MNLDTFSLLKIKNQGDNKDWTKWLIFYMTSAQIPISLPTNTSTRSKLAVSIIDNEHSTMIILKGKLLVLGEKPCFNYWAIFPLEYFPQSSNQPMTSLVTSTSWRTWKTTLHFTSSRSNWQNSKNYETGLQYQQNNKK